MKFALKLVGGMVIVGAMIWLVGCGNIPVNQAILQDVANDLGTPIVASPNGAMMAATPSGRGESTSAQKAKAFWGN